MLFCAANDNALCQMSLAYRHFIGADGLHQDCDVAIGRINHHTLSYLRYIMLNLQVSRMFLFCVLRTVFFLQVREKSGNLNVWSV